MTRPNERSSPTPAQLLHTTVPNTSCRAGGQMSENRPVLDRAEFEGMLRAAERSYWDKHPFHQRMDAGELDPVHLRAWVANRWYY
ncbi:MAG: hypothetical protein ACRDRE_24630, partial [Pseudonocardiaceae bacterium]